MAAARRIDPPGAVASKWFVTAVGTSVAVVAAQLLVVRLLDAGWLYPTYRFYLAVVAVPILVGTLLSKRWAALLASAALSTIATYVFYKFGLQTNRWTELGNDLDWAAVLILTSVAVLGSGALAPAWRSRDEIWK